MSRSPTDNLPKTSSRSWVEIDQRAWRENFTSLQTNVSPATVAPVIKADAYGLGAYTASHSFRYAGAELLIVSCVQEALEIGDAGADVLILGAPLPEEIPEIINHDFIITVPNFEIGQTISETAKALGKTVRAHIKIDTGMGRLGFGTDEAVAAIDQAATLPNLELEGIYSHFPAAGRQDAFTLNQIQVLTGIIEELHQRGIDFKYRHIANSTATAGLPKATMAPFNMVRCGLDLHGAHLSITARPYETTPVLTLKSKLVAVRHHPYGASVGYGRTYTVSKKEGERIGVVAIGYADGYPRCLSNRGHMLVRGKVCPVVGLICMDYTMISLEDVPNAQRGDEVVVIGEQQNASIPLTEVARTAETIPYEITCLLGRRVARHYYEGPSRRKDTIYDTEAAEMSMDSDGEH